MSACFCTGACMRPGGLCPVRSDFSSGVSSARQLLPSPPLGPVCEALVHAAEVAAREQRPDQLRICADSVASLAEAYATLKANG